MSFWVTNCNKTLPSDWLTNAFGVTRNSGVISIIALANRDYTAADFQRSHRLDQNAILVIKIFRQKNFVIADLVARLILKPVTGIRVV